MFAVLAAAVLVAGIPSGQAEVLCDLAYKAQVEGDATFWTRAWDYLGKGAGVPVERKLEIQAFCLGRAVEKRRVLETKAHR